MKKIKIKICGITRKEDALLTEKFGAWAVGFIFVKMTPRYISPETAAEIIKELSQNITKIGVFMNSQAEEVIKIAKQAKLDSIQLHGEETPEYCEILAKKTNLKIIKAISVKNIEDLSKIKLYKDKISLLLLDTYDSAFAGGTGKTFDWEIAKAAKQEEIPIILAGGINADNIKQAYEQVNPYAFDISSGVEKAKGIKDAKKLKELFSMINPE